MGRPGTSRRRGTVLRSTAAINSDLAKDNLEPYCQVSISTLRGLWTMNVEQPKTLERPDLRDPLPAFQTNDLPPSRRPRKYGWLWLVMLTLLVVSVYFYVHSHAAPANAATTAGVFAGTNLGKNAGSIPVVLAQARKGDIGVYFTGLGAVTPIYTGTVKSQISGYLMPGLYKERQT